MRLPLPSTPCLAGLLAFAALCLTGDPVRLLSWDTLLHVHLGERMLDQGALVETDPSSWATDRRYIDHEWLPQLALGVSRRAFGLEGLVIFTALAVGATFSLLAAWMRRRGVGPPVVLALLAGGFVALKPFFFARPFLVSWFLAVLWTLLLERLSRGELEGPRWLAAAAASMFVWVNLHGGFFLAFFLLAVFGLAQVWRIVTAPSATAASAAEGGEERRSATRLLLWMAIGGNLSLMVSGLNVYGFRLHAHFLSYLMNARLITSIAEWQAPFFHDRSQLALLLFLGFSLVVALAGPRRLTPPELLLVVALLLAALKAQRNLPFFVLLTLPIAGVQLEGLLAELAAVPSVAARPARWVAALSRRAAAGEGRRRGALTAAAVLALGVLAVGVWKIRPIDLGRKFPVAAASFVSDHPELFGGRMFNLYDWGGYLAWALYPDHRVFINGLQDHYGEAHYLEYREVLFVRPLWQRILDQRRIDWIIVSGPSPLTAMLVLQPGWRRVYRDPMAEIFVRRDAAGAAEAAAASGV